MTDKKVDYARSDTHRVCVKLSNDHHEFLKERGKLFGKFGMSEALRQILDREMCKRKKAKASKEE